MSDCGCDSGGGGGDSGGGGCDSGGGGFDSGGGGCDSGGGDTSCTVDTGGGTTDHCSIGITDHSGGGLFTSHHNWGAAAYNDDSFNRTSTWDNDTVGSSRRRNITRQGKTNKIRFYVSCAITIIFIVIVGVIIYLITSSPRFLHATIEDSHFAHLNSDWTSENGPAVNWANTNRLNANWPSANWTSENWTSANWPSENSPRVNWTSANWPRVNWTSVNTSDVNYPEVDWASFNRSRQTLREFVQRISPQHEMDQPKLDQLKYAKPSPESF